MSHYNEHVQVKKCGNTIASTMMGFFFLLEERLQKKRDVVLVWLDFVCFVDTGSPFVVQTGLEFLILQPQLLQGWDYRYAPLYPVSNSKLQKYVAN